MPDAYEFMLKKYGAYTEIEKKAFPVVESGKDCVIVAPTGSGKTEAATIPILNHLSKQPRTEGIKMIYITPLRALNRDMIRRFDEICAALGISVAVRHGDTLQKERARQARAAPMVLITTPETLQSILPTKAFKNALRNVSVVVIDEVHELYYNKRGAQLSLALERLEELSPDFQRIAVSATVGDPDTIAKFISNGGNCEVIIAENQKRMKLRVEMPTKSSGAHRDMIEKFGLDESSLARLEAIAGSVKESKSSLIFANTRQIVEALGSRLLYMEKETPFGGIGVHHGSLDREERIALENRFKEGKLKSIIATSSLELGIDIGRIDKVIQYGSPRQALRLIQRAGRSGHTEKGTAEALVICTSVIDVAEAAAISINAEERALERFSVQKMALDVLANQLCGIALDKSVCTKEEALGIVSRSFAYSELKMLDLESLLYFMSAQHMIGFDGQKIYSGSSTRMYYYSHLSTIPDRKRYMVKMAVDNRAISSLDESFVASSIEENSVFITKGLPWKVISVDEEVISVEPSTDLEAAVPDWVGEDIPVSRETAMKVFDILHSPSSAMKAMDSEAAEGIAELSKGQKEIALPSRSKILIEEGDGYSIIYTGLGTLANEALSRIIAHHTVVKTGRSINTKSSPYMIFLETGAGSMGSMGSMDNMSSMEHAIDISNILTSLRHATISDRLLEAAKGTDIFMHKFITIAKLFGVVDKRSSLPKSLARRLLRLFEDTPVYKETVRELMQNYFDIKSLQEMLSGISSGKISIEKVNTSSLSPLSRAILDSAYYTRELIMPLLPSDALISAFIGKVLSKQIELLCVYCGFHFKRKLLEINKNPHILCPSCASPMVSIDSEEARLVVMKRIKGVKLIAKEKETMKGVMKIASLFESHGGKAAVALSTYGVGPGNAARVLRMFRREDRLFYMDIIEAQKNFIKTKKYWSV